MAPVSDQPGNRPDNATERQLSLPEFVAELSTLISELETAKGGSQDLDIRIHYGFRILGGHGEDIASLLIKNGISWPTVQETLHETVPPYSTSLDASLQGEEIVFSIRSAKERRWGAMQRTADGGEELAWAATEPLARRLAALKSHHAELTKALEDEQNLTTQTDDDQASSPLPATSTLDESDLRDEKAMANGHQSERQKQTQEMTGLSKEEGHPPPDIPGHLSDHNSGQALQDAPDTSDPDTSNKEEKDWEILF